MVVPQISQEKKDISEVSMEKATVLGVAERGRDVCGRRGLFGLFFYAGAVTAALIVVIALGAVYQQQTLDLCDSQQKAVAAQCSGGQHSRTADPEDEAGESRHLKLKNGKNQEEDEVIKSKNGRYETVYSRHGNSSHVVISVMDNQRGMTGIYFPPTEECYLMGGKAHDGASGVEPEDNGVAKYNDDEAPTYEVLYDEEIKDKSLLPMPLQKVCHDKPTYWMQRQTSEEHHRKKRGLYAFRVCTTYSSCRYNGKYYSPCRICMRVECRGPSYSTCLKAVCAQYGC